MNQKSKKVVVVGAGITGLSATFYLNKTVQALNLPVDITLVEASPRLGGKIQTEYRNGFVIEKGPDSFLERKVSATELIQDVGLESNLVKNASDKVYVLVKDRMHEMPEGAIMGVPTQMASFMKTGLFSVQGKLRATCDFIIPRSNVAGDQSVGHFIRRRLGDEVTENLVEPLLSGIYIGDIDQLSLMSTFPQFYNAEFEHRSIIRGMKKLTKSQPENQLTSENQGVFLTLKGGLQSLVDAIEERLKSISIVTGTMVTEINESAGQYELCLNNNEVMQADSIVLALPHLSLTRLFPEKEYIKELNQVPATTVATVVLAFDEDEVQNIANGAGFVVSRHSDYTITACTWTHKKWPHTAPAGKALLRCYVGRVGEETVVDLSDTEIEEIVLADLAATLNIEAKPDFTIVTRWIEAFPQYIVGHQARLERFRAQLGQDLPGVFVAGSSFDGIGLPDCITHGRKVAGQVLDYFKFK